MQSRHSVTGIQYRGGLMIDYKNISLSAQFSKKFSHGKCSHLCSSSRDTLALVWIDSLQLTMAKMPMPRFPLSLWCQRMSTFFTITHFPLVQTQAQLMYPICPLWAPIHQPLTHGRGSGWRDNLLLKCLNGWGSGHSHKAFFSECSEFAVGHLDRSGCLRPYR